MPSTFHRSSVRGFRRSSAASSSLVRNSERIGSEVDIGITHTLFCVQFSLRTGIYVRKIFLETWGEFLSYASSSNGDGPHLRATGCSKAHCRASLIASIMLSYSISSGRPDCDQKVHNKFGKRSISRSGYQTGAISYTAPRLQMSSHGNTGGLPRFPVPHDLLRMKQRFPKLPDF